MLESDKKKKKQIISHTKTLFYQINEFLYILHILTVNSAFRDLKRVVNKIGGQLIENNLVFRIKRVKR